MKQVSFSRREFLQSAAMAPVALNVSTMVQTPRKKIVLTKAPPTPNADCLQGYVDEFPARFHGAHQGVLSDYRQVFEIDASAFPPLEADGIELAQTTLKEAITHMDGGAQLTEATWHRLEHKQAQIRTHLHRMEIRRRMDWILGKGMHQPFELFEE